MSGAFDVASQPIYDEAVFQAHGSVMVILLVGATGFIGRHLLQALRTCGHSVIATSRSGRGPDLPGVEWRALDLARLSRDTEAFSWPESVEVVINASGLLSGDTDLLYAVHDRGSRALFGLAGRHGVRIIQFSALGAGKQPDIPFLDSKTRADDALLELDMPAVVLRPSLVIGRGGASSGWLSRLSPWPLIPLLDTQAQVQPLHIDDLVAAVLAVLSRWPAKPCVLPLVGPEPLTLPRLIDQLRMAQGWPPAVYVQLPRGLASLGAWLGDRLDWRALNGQTLRMARRDNLASPAPLAETSEFRAAPLEARLVDWPTPMESASLALRPVLLAVLAMVWLGTALACLGPGYAWGMRIMTEAGVVGWPAAMAVISGALLDALLGLGLLAKRWRRLALQAQITLMLAYMLLISLLVPHYWYDPFASVLKNAALLAATLWLLWTEPKPDKRGR